jgi:hypothetical protein
MSCFDHKRMYFLSLVHWDVNYYFKPFKQIIGLLKGNSITNED